LLAPRTNNSHASLDFDPPCKMPKSRNADTSHGGALRYRVARFRALIAGGNGLVALSYRGYGGSTGRPTEAGLIADAEAAYVFAATRYPAERIALWGESLGSEVAVALAAGHMVGVLCACIVFCDTRGAIAQPATQDAQSWERLPDGRVSIEIKGVRVVMPTDDQDASNIIIWESSEASA
jgi:pimeloyl-ACP methyl ester carboxylesterase